MNISDRKKIFPMFKNNPEIVYLDNAALTFKPKIVIDKGVEYYEKYSISTRTADTKLGIKINQDLKNTKEIISKFIGCKEQEIIFTSGTTDGLNQIAKMLSEVIDNGTILFSFFNHSSAIVPFIETFKGKNIKFKYCETNDDFLNSINEDTKLVVIPESTNNFQIQYNLNEIYKKCKKYNAILVNDCAQAIVHKKIVFNNCDVLAFSGNKIYGPTGTGALIIKEELLEKLKPVKWGGGQVQNIFDLCGWNIRNSSSKWEPGTPNFSGLLQLGAAIEFFTSFDMDEIFNEERKIAEYAYDKLLEVPNIKIDSKRGDKIILFNIKNIPAQEIASYLGNRNIYVRSGAFCAYKFKEVPNLSNSYVRISLAMYNGKSDINKLVKELKNGGNFIEIF